MTQFQQPEGQKSRIQEILNLSMCSDSITDTNENCVKWFKTGENELKRVKNPMLSLVIHRIKGNFLIKYFTQEFPSSEFSSSALRPPPFLCPSSARLPSQSRCPPPWILKQGGLESSGRIM